MMKVSVILVISIASMCRNKLSVREQSEMDSSNSDVSGEINYTEKNTRHSTISAGHIRMFQICWYITTESTCSFIVWKS